MESNDIAALIGAYSAGDPDRFYAIALRLAASEAHAGCKETAAAIRLAVDKSQYSRDARVDANPTGRPSEEVVTASWPESRLADWYVDDRLSATLKALVEEHRRSRPLRAKGLSPRRKLLITGAPGTGKTMAAAVLAGELGVPLFPVSASFLLADGAKRAAAALRSFFASMPDTRGVYCVDFDTGAPGVDLLGDVFVECLVRDRSQALIVATVGPRAQSSSRVDDCTHRFDATLRCERPSEAVLAALFRSRLGRLISHDSVTPSFWEELAGSVLGMTQADAVAVCQQAYRRALLEGRGVISASTIWAAVKER